MALPSCAADWNFTRNSSRLRRLGTRWPSHRPWALPQTGLYSEGERAKWSLGSGQRIPRVVYCPHHLCPKVLHCPQSEVCAH